ncbi:hypothetical protein NPIL_4031, partial [Nephila pilipes]
HRKRPTNLPRSNKPPFVTRIHGRSLLRRIELATRFIFFSPNSFFFFHTAPKRLLTSFRKRSTSPLVARKSFSTPSPTYSHLRRAIPADLSFPSSSSHVNSFEATV